MRDMAYPKTGPDKQQEHMELSENDSRHTQLTECRIRRLLLSAVSVAEPQLLLGTS